MYIYIYIYKEQHELDVHASTHKGSADYLFQIFSRRILRGSLGVPQNISGSMGVSAFDPPRNQAAENIVLEAFQGFSQKTKRPGCSWRIAQGTSLVLTPQGTPWGTPARVPPGVSHGDTQGGNPRGPGHSP